MSDLRCYNCIFLWDDLIYRISVPCSPRWSAMILQCLKSIILWGLLRINLFLRWWRLVETRIHIWNVLRLHYYSIWHLWVRFTVVLIWVDSVYHLLQLSMMRRCVVELMSRFIILLPIIILLSVIFFRGSSCTKRQSTVAFLVS